MPEGFVVLFALSELFVSVFFVSELFVSELFVLSELVEGAEVVLLAFAPLPPDELELLLFALPYPSEYQPPPFKMKLPLTICRRA